MIIDRIELRILRMALVHSFQTSSSQRTELAHIIVKASAGDLVGWGECAAPVDPYYCEETTETSWHMLRDFLVPAILGKPFDDAEQFRRNYGRVKRNNFAKAGLEMAAWDLLAKSRNEPLSKSLGGTRAEILSGVSLGIEDDFGRLRETIDRHLADGYRRIKLKIGPGHDVEYLERVREHYPDVPLMGDANSAYRLSDIARLKELDRFNLMMIEQPLAHDDIIDHAVLQKQLATPVCLDESITSLEDARKALDLGSGRIINIKAGRVGGLVEAKAIHDLCVARGVPVWCGGMHEYGIGRAANVALASLAGFTIPGDVSGSDKYFAEDIVDPAINAVNGAIAVPSTPGIGWEPNEERMQKFTVREMTFEAGGAR